MDLEVVDLEVVDSVVVHQAFVWAEEDLVECHLGELVLIELFHDLRADPIDILIIDRIEDIIGGAIDLGIGDGGIHLIGLVPGVIIGIILLYILEEVF